MSESVYTLSEPPDERDYARVDELALNMQSESQSRAGAFLWDPEINDWHYRILEPLRNPLDEVVAPELLGGGKYRQMQAEIFAHNRAGGLYYPISYAQRMVQFVVSKQIEREDPELYYEEVRKPGTWRKNNIFREVDSDELQLDLLIRKLAASIAMGYVVPKALSSLIAGQKADWTLADFGSSRGLGLVQWLENSFRIPTVFYPPKKYGAIGPDLKPDIEAEERLTELIAEASAPTLAAGFDISPAVPGDTPAEEWVYTNDFPLGRSFWDNERVKEFYRLLKLRPEGLKLFRGNTDVAGEEAIPKMLEGLEGRKARLVTAMGMIFEQPPDRAENVSENAKAISADGVRLMVGEFATVKAGAPLGLEIIRKQWWQRLGAFALFSINPAESDRLPIEICRFLNRDCEALWFTPLGRRILMGEAEL